MCTRSSTENPEFIKHLRNFGEMGVVRSISRIKSNLENPGMKCMFLEYAQNHEVGKYHMLNIRTKFILLSSAIIWIKKWTVSTYQEIKIPRQPVITLKINMSPIIGVTSNESCQG